MVIKKDDSNSTRDNIRKIFSWRFILVCTLGSKFLYRMKEGVRTGDLFLPGKEEGGNLPAYTFFGLYLC